MKCKICKINECSEDNNVCQFCSTSGMEYKKTTMKQEKCEQCEEIRELKKMNTGI